MCKMRIGGGGGSGWGGGGGESEGGRAISKPNYVAAIEKMDPDVFQNVRFLK